MSQQQAFVGANSSPVNPNIEFIQGTTGSPTGPNPANFTVDFTSSTGDFIIHSDPVTHTVDFKFANEVSGTATTVGATTANVLTIPLGAVAGAFQFEARVKGFDPSTPSAAGFNLYATFITDGTTARLVGEQPILNQDPALEASSANFLASGNNAVLQVLGVTALTIHWAAEAEIT